MAHMQLNCNSWTLWTEGGVKINCRRTYEEYQEKVRRVQRYFEYISAQNHINQYVQSSRLLSPEEARFLEYLKSQFENSTHLSMQKIDEADEIVTNMYRRLYPEVPDDFLLFPTPIFIILKYKREYMTFLNVITNKEES